jgi:hypothetical protein
MLVVHRRLQLDLEVSPQEVVLMHLLVVPQAEYMTVVATEDMVQLRDTAVVVVVVVILVMAEMELAAQLR